MVSLILSMKESSASSVGGAVGVGVAEVSCDMVQAFRGLVQNYNHTDLPGQVACHEPLLKTKFQELAGRADT